MSDIVTKALAFKALLTTSQQATLEQTFTTTLEGRWSNLPCGSGCRNGVQFSTLTSDQLTAALAVIQAAAGTTANEGYDEFNQIRLADTYLNESGGGSGYGEGIYFIAFLNTPSTTGAWMLQFGGHHYAANIAFNGGHIVGATPQFEGLEPYTFTTNGTTYSPLAEEHDAMAAMLASLRSSQLTTAKLSATYSDVTMSPGESNGGNGTFPTTKVGVQVNTLSSDQRSLVFEAMKPWLHDANDAVAANLLSTYQNELDGTYIAFTGNGTSGDASSFLNTNTNYVRIDGPSVWIEFICQTGVVFRNQIHYHSIWRDHSRDYGQDLSLTTALDSSAAGSVTATSAASYAVGTLAPEALGTLFGTGLASTTASASTTPLPTTLGNVQVQITDSSGAVQYAPLIYVSPTQISFENPANVSTGSETIDVLNASTLVGEGTAVINSVAPGLFSANSTGQGVAAAFVIRVTADGTQTVEDVLELNSSTNLYDPVPISVSNTTDQVYLILFGTGFRNASSLSNVSATIGDVNATVTYAGAQGTFAGLDQANVIIPSSLAGHGNANVVLTVDGKISNTILINVE